MEELQESLRRFGELFGIGFARSDGFCLELNVADVSQRRDGDCSLGESESDSPGQRQRDRLSIRRGEFQNRPCGAAEWDLMIEVAHQARAAEWPRNLMKAVNHALDIRRVSGVG